MRRYDYERKWAARPAYEKVLELSIGDSDLCSFEAGLALLDIAACTPPDEQRIWVAIASALARARRWNEGEGPDVLPMLHALHPVCQDNYVHHLAMAEVLRSQGHHEESTLGLCRAALAAPDSAVVHMQVGNDLWGDGLLAEAIEGFEAAVRTAAGLDNLADEARKTLLEIYAGPGRIEEASDALAGASRPIRDADEVQTLVRMALGARRLTEGPALFREHLSDLHDDWDRRLPPGESLLLEAALAGASGDVDAAAAAVAAALEAYRASEDEVDRYWLQTLEEMASAPAAAVLGWLVGRYIGDMPNVALPALTESVLAELDLISPLLLLGNAASAADPQVALEAVEKELALAGAESELGAKAQELYLWLRGLVDDPDG